MLLIHNHIQQPGYSPADAHHNICTSMLIIGAAFVNIQVKIYIAPLSHLSQVASKLRSTLKLVMSLSKVCTIQYMFVQ